MMEWISAEKMIPPSGLPVIVAMMLPGGGYFLEIGCYRGSNLLWRDGDYRKMAGVTHWMLLPPAPEDEGEN
jgi:hypothetical protein